MAILQQLSARAYTVLSDLRSERSSSMKREWKQACLGLLSLSLVPWSSSLLRAQNKPQNKVEKKEAAAMKLKVGDTAPDFTLLSFDGKELTKVSLHDFRGKKNVALAFFVFAFTGG
jgi:hypothetical protein